ncbi:putative lipid II flippase FtsW [Desulfovermiculus halophilus]|jgi:cell division protein FtsW|uniref:putative lipid II flippase FtsW n=1 Tax=Desulfovermiculus halophilus TaxID=339722 RepID=UPI0004836B59|nr:putative lipid II flippase FtsW [Desulfovermiculus halophilus]
MSGNREQEHLRELADWWLVGSALILMGLGLVMVYSASGVMAERLFADSDHFFLRQSVYAGMGLAVMWIGAKIPMGFVYRFVYLWLMVVLVLLALTLTPLGVRAGGASRWLDMGSFSLQPLELAKIALVLYLGYFLSHKQDKMKTFSVGFVPPVIITGIIAGMLLLQPDFGGAVFIAALFFTMSMVGGTRLLYLLSSGLLCLGIGAYMIVSSPYRLKRWLAFLDPFQNAADSGYQVVQSLYGLGLGGLFGQGLGAGKQKLFFLPEGHTDFIVSVLGEELGFAGLSILFVCLGVYMFRGLTIALNQDDLQDRFTALGLCLVVVLCALLNLAVVMGAVPPKGLPMPFISYGGSNLLVACMCTGLLVNIERRGRGAHG